MSTTADNPEDSETQQRQSKVTLWTKNMYSRSVPHQLIPEIPKMKIMPGYVDVFTECKSIVDLDLFIAYLKNPEEDFDSDEGRCFELLLLGEYYQLPALVKKSADAICGTLYSRNVYFLLRPSLILNYKDELQHLLNDIRGPSFPIAVPFESSDGLRKEVDLVLTKTFFPKITAAHQLSNKKFKVQSIPCKMEIFEAVLRSMKDPLDFELFDEDQLLSMMMISCLLGYRKMFCDLVVKLKYDVCDVMAQDIYNFLYGCNLENDSYDRLFSAIANRLTNKDWQSKLLIPMMFNQGSDDNPSSRIRFLKRDPVDNDRLLTFKMRMPEENSATIVQELLKRFPDQVEKFWNDESSLNFEKGPEVLLHLLHLGSKFGYDKLYLEGYVALLREEIPIENPVSLHGHLYVEEEILAWKATGDSKLVTLVAEDGTRAKIHKNTLSIESEHFKDFLNIPKTLGAVQNYSQMVIPLIHCPDGVVLHIWINYMTCKPLWFPSHVSMHIRQRVCADLRRIAGFYMVPGLMEFTLNNDLYELNFDFHLTYESIPKFDFLSEEEKQRCVDKYTAIEFDHFDRIFDSSYCLRMDIFEWVLFLLRIDWKRFTEAGQRALELYVDLNGEYLKGLEEVPEQVFSQMNYNNFSLHFVMDLFRYILLKTGDAFPILGKIENHMRYLGTLTDIDSSCLILLEELEFLYGKTLYIHSDSYKFIQIDVETLKANFEDIFELRVFKGKLIWFESQKRKVFDFYQNKLYDLPLPVLPDDFAELIFTFCMDELIAITIPVDGSPNFLWRYQSDENKWEGLPIDTHGYSLRGRPWVGGDRLYFLPTFENNDWIRYLIKDKDDNWAVRLIEPIESHSELLGLLKYSPKRKFMFSFEFCSYCHSSLSSSESSNECPNHIFSDLVCPPERSNSAFLFVKSEVLVIQRDSLEISERLKWPVLPLKMGFHNAVFSDKCLHILYLHLNHKAFTVYKLNFEEWTFIKVISGASMNECLWDIFAADGKCFTNYPDDESLYNSSNATDTWNEEQIAEIFKDSEGDVDLKFDHDNEWNSIYS